MKRRPPNDTNKPRVLCVDDEPHILSALRRRLQRKFDVSSATSAAEALDILDEVRPIVVVSDMQMPGMDGATFLGEVRRRLADSVRILLTGHADLEAAIQAVNEGYVFRFLTKPCPSDKLIQTIDAAVEQYRLVTHDRDLMQAKLDSMSNQLLQAERLATLGTLLSGVGHELNNVLTVLLPSVQILKLQRRRGVLPEESQLDRLARVGEHLKTHARYLLNFGRPSDGAVGTLDLAEIVRETVEMLRTAGKTQNVSTHVYTGDEPLSVRVNRTHLEQVLVNLIGNAADASIDKPERERLIEIRAEINKADRMVSCSVTDYGCGIPKEKHEAIFDTYYTTKPPGKGTGLGLPVVRKIVRSYGGDIAVRSRPGEGSTFLFSFPVSDPCNRQNPDDEEQQSEAASLAVPSASL